MKGWVKAWFDQKGYGFIVPEDGSDDVFAHVYQIDGGLDALEPDSLVSFDVVVSADGRRQAQDILLLEPGDPETRSMLRPAPRQEAPAAPSARTMPPRREPLFSPQRRSELAEEAAAALLDIMKTEATDEKDCDSRDLRLEAVRAMFDALHKDAGTCR